VVDLAQLQEAGCFSGPILSKQKVFSQVAFPAWFALAQLMGHHSRQEQGVEVLLLYSPQDSLNAFMALGKPAWQEARATLTRLLSKDEGQLRDNAALRQAAIIPQVRGSRCYQAGMYPLTGCNQLKAPVWILCDEGAV